MIFPLKSGFFYYFLFGKWHHHCWKPETLKLIICLMKTLSICFLCPLDFTQSTIFPLIFWMIFLKPKYWEKKERKRKSYFAFMVKFKYSYMKLCQFLSDGHDIFMFLMLEHPFKFFVLILEKERDIDLLFPLFMHSLVDSCMCPDHQSNL